MSTNVALASNGSTGSASSTHSSAGYPVSRVTDGDRTGSTGYWNDNTSSTFDDWFQVDFSGSQTIGEIDVFGVQDGLATLTPTLIMTSTQYGLTDFDVQYWNGSSWVTVTGGSVTGNTNVWRQFTFTPVTTTKIRVLIHNTQDTIWSRLVEIEAWTSSAPSSPSSPSPATTATGVSQTPTLTWSAGGATSYDIYFGLSASPPLVVSGATSASYVPGLLSGSTIYYWKIVAINAGGSTTGSVWSFTTMAAPVPTLTPTYVINGVSRTSIVKINTTHVNDNLSARNTFEVTLWDFTVDVSVRPVVGQTIVVTDTDGLTLLFAGTINDIDESYVNNTIPFMEYVLHCVDYSQICDRFLVAEAYIDPAQTLSTIVNDIVTNVLAGESLTTTGVQTGPVIPETKVFNYKTVTQVFNELTSLTGYPWWVDYSKVLYFVPRTGLATSIVLNKSNSLSCKVKTSRSVGPYRNVQYVRAGTAETASRTDHTTGDGKRRTFDTKFEISRGTTKGSSPTVTVNGSSKTLGRKGIDTGFDFYWITGSNQITQDDAGTLLISSDDLAITYVGRYPSVVVSQRDAEILSRKATEGGTGIYMNLKVDYNLNDLVAQTNLTNSLLDRYGFIPQQLEIVTDLTGIRSGMLINCVFPENQVSGNFIVQSVRGVDVSGKFLRYTVTLVNG